MAGPEDKLKAYADQVEAGLESRIQGALNDMPLIDRRVLAIRGYLRYPLMGRGTIDANWAWTNDDMAEFRKTTEFRQMKQAVSDLKRVFAAANAGHTLEVDPDKQRDLDEQVDSWNK